MPYRGSTSLQNGISWSLRSIRFRPPNQSSGSLACCLSVRVIISSLFSRPARAEVRVDVVVVRNSSLPAGVQSNPGLATLLDPRVQHARGVGLPNHGALDRKGAPPEAPPKQRGRCHERPSRQSAQDKERPRPRSRGAWHHKKTSLGWQVTGPAAWPLSQAAYIGNKAEET